METTIFDEESVIYLDYNATTPIHPNVGEEMIPFITKFFGNPSSSHIYGNKTKMAIQKARNQVGKMLNSSQPNDEILFTSGGSESNNLAIKGSIEWLLENDPRFNNSANKLGVITSEIEHPSVMEVYKYLENSPIFKDKIKVHYLRTTKEGMVDLEHLKEILKNPENSIGFISVMHANNETGALQPIRDISKICHEANPEIIVHSDAAQSIGKIVVDVQDMGVDLLSVCSHKFYGPKGIGALFMNKSNDMPKKIEKCKQIHGASHEKNLRAGTENVLEIVGLGKAAELVTLEMKERYAHLRKMRDLLLQRFTEAFPNPGDFIVQGPKIEIGKENVENRLPNTLYISFPGIEANLILDYASKKVAVSAGAACHSEDLMNKNKENSHKNIKMSHVLKAMKVDPNVAMGTLRISTGIFTKEEHIETAAQELIKIISKLKNQNTNPQFSSNIEEKPEKLEKKIEKNEPVQQKAEKPAEVCQKPEENEEFFPLTKTTHGLGCGCKIPAKTLTEILESLPKQQKILSKLQNNVLVGTETADDCCVYALPERINNFTDNEDSSTKNIFQYFSQSKVSKEGIVQTLDFFTPICDSPRDYGAISAANSLSDIWAMGAFPLFGLNIVTFPIKILPKRVLSEILLGAQEKCDEAGIPVLGGHSIEDTEPKFGMSVCGLINLEKRKIWKNCGAKIGDVLCITKPIGVGVLMTAVKREMIKESSKEIQFAINNMKTLNKYAAEAMICFEEQRAKGEVVNAVTDITGFGLFGHLKEMLEGSIADNKKLNAKVFAKSIPFLEKAKEFVEMEVIPGGSLNNYNFSLSVCEYDKTIDYATKILLNDAQTSGGLMFSFPKEKLKEIKQFFDEKQIPFHPIAEIVELENSTENNCKISILNQEFVL